MSSAIQSSAPSAKINRTTGDSFLLGLSVMLVVNMLQRLVGLARNLGFCYTLSDAELGHWAMANTFFIIAAPLIVLGLPGAFGKFVEVYRLRGQLLDYLRVTIILCAIAMAISAIGLTAFPKFFFWLIFNETAGLHQIGWLAITLLAVTVFNSANEFVSALREVRLVSLMQFLNSVGFAVFGGIALWMRPQWDVLLPAYTLACIVGTLPCAILWLRKRGEWGATKESFAISEMAFRVLPFAAALWCNNLLTNLFELSDRYMLLHLTPGDATIGQGLAGQYHCGRIIPNLMTSLAMLLCGVLLPYLSADWEQGKKDRVESRLNHTLQFVAVTFMLISIGAIVLSPLMFDQYLGGRYEAAKSILPQVMLQCIWLSLFLVAQAYLFCIERGRHIIGIQLLGLGINLLLNYILITQWGLFGAVTSTTIAYGVIIGLMSWRMAKEGTTLGWNTMFVCFAPASLVLGANAAMVMVVILVVLAARTEWLLTAEDRDEIDALLLPKLAKLGVRLKTLW